MRQLKRMICLNLAVILLLTILPVSSVACNTEIQEELEFFSNPPPGYDIQEFLASGISYKPLSIKYISENFDQSYFIHNLQLLIRFLLDYCPTDGNLVPFPGFRPTDGNLWPFPGFHPTDGNLWPFPGFRPTDGNLWPFPESRPFYDDIKGLSRIQSPISNSLFDSHLLCEEDIVLPCNPDLYCSFNGTSPENTSEKDEGMPPVDNQPVNFDFINEKGDIPYNSNKSLIPFLINSSE